MTINELYELCKDKIEDGYGNSEIVLCVNGDEFHLLENNFSSPVYNDSMIYEELEEWGLSEEVVIILN